MNYSDVNLPYGSNIAVDYFPLPNFSIGASYLSIGYFDESIKTRENPLRSTDLWISSLYITYYKSLRKFKRLKFGPHLGIGNVNIDQINFFSIYAGVEILFFLGGNISLIGTVTAYYTSAPENPFLNSNSLGFSFNY